MAISIYDFYSKISNIYNSATERKSLKMKSHHKNYISDATNYDLLYQSEYAHEYAYIPSSRRHGLTIDNDSNFTRRTLDFPYHQETQISFYDPGNSVSIGGMGSEELKEPAMKKIITSVFI